MDTDFDEQENEVLALQAIFSEEEYLKFNSVKQPETSQDGAECSDSLSGASCSQRELLLTCGDFSAHIQLSDSFYIKGKRTIQFCRVSILKPSIVYF